MNDASKVPWGPAIVPRRRLVLSAREEAVNQAMGRKPCVRVTAAALSGV